MSNSGQNPIDYKRQLSLPAMTVAKQRALTSSKVLVLAETDGAGFLVQALCQSGVGEIRVATGAGYNIERVAEVSLDGETSLSIFPFAGLDELEKMIADVDVVCETLLNWQLKLGLSDRCMRLGVPLIHSGIVGHRYQCYSIMPGKSACLRCALPKAGIEDFPLGPTSVHPLIAVEAWAGSVMAIDVLKIVADLGVLQTNTLWRLDPLSGDREAVRNLKPSDDCPDCRIYQ